MSKIMKTNEWIFLNDIDIADYEIMSNFSNNRVANAEYEPSQDNLGKFDQGFLGLDSDELMINLEDILLEEDVINNLLNALYQKKLVSGLWGEWWNRTNMSSVKQMDILFEEQTSKNLLSTFKSYCVCLFDFWIQMKVNYIAKIKPG